MMSRQQQSLPPVAALRMEDCKLLIPPRARRTKTPADVPVEMQSRAQPGFVAPARTGERSPVRWEEAQEEAPQPLQPRRANGCAREPAMPPMEPPTRAESPLLW